MSATRVGGPIHREGSRDKDGHREYTVTWKVVVTNSGDGPAIVANAAGLAAIGSSMTGALFGNDNDAYALCWPNLKMSPRSSSKSKPEREFYWEVEQLFSTKPLSRCQDASVTDPLAEPQKVSGSFVRYCKQAEKDRHGEAILSSSFEQITGIEKDANRPSVVIEQNVASLGLGTFAAMIDTLNDATLWGAPARTVKLSNASWERKLYGTCTYYYTRRFEFEVRIGDDKFDLEDIADAGFKVFDETIVGVDTGTDSIDRLLPNNYVLYKDRRGENTPRKILLDGNGSALTDPNNPVYIPTVELYGESNFLTLGIPTSF